ncbi:hypothetical protein [Sphingomonas sp.]|uniref:hypothetical protein n=1 Tax=Sphingomonas sp. TaxID=28214 RepID=UPI001B09BA91|nr:hypothetical protein [Sphingomonas sp.]MBO9712492.1 hypothetical protein [Sphingomonas sp.]
MTDPASRSSATKWHRYLRIYVLLVFGLPAIACVIAAGLAVDGLHNVDSTALSRAGKESLHFFQNPANLLVVTSASIISVVLSLLVAWVIHTRNLRFKILLICLFLMPQALPYEAITWIARTIPSPPIPLATYVLVYRYMPICLVFSYLSVSRFSHDILMVAQSLGLSESQIIKNRVIPNILSAIIAQFLFVLMIMATDNVGMSYSSGGQLTGLGNVINDWSKTTDNRAIAYALTFVVAIVGAIAAGGANVLGWWRASIRGKRKELFQRRRSVAVWPLWALAVLIGGTPLAVSLSHYSEMNGKLMPFLAAISLITAPTVIYLAVGIFLSAGSALVIYLVVQQRETRPPSGALSVAVAISMFGLLIPPVMRGDFFVTPTSYLFQSAGSAGWAAFWMWVTLFPAIAALAALHPVSRNNRFQSVLENAGVRPGRRLMLSIGHAHPALLGAALLWLFFALFDTSVSRSTAGSDRPFGVWFRDQISTTYDPGFIATGVVISYLLALLLGMATLLFAISRRSNVR